MKNLQKMKAVGDWGRFLFKQQRLSDDFNQPLIQPTEEESSTKKNGKSINKEIKNTVTSTGEELKTVLGNTDIIKENTPAENIMIKGVYSGYSKGNDFFNQNGWFKGSYLPEKNRVLDNNRWYAGEFSEGIIRNNRDSLVGSYADGNIYEGDSAVVAETYNGDPGKAITQFILYKPEENTAENGSEYIEISSDSYHSY